MMNTGTKTIRSIVNWFAVVAKERAGLRRLVDIYGDLNVEDLKGAKAIGLRAEEVLEFAGNFVFARLRCCDGYFERWQIDVVLILCFRIVRRRREVGLCERYAWHRREFQCEREHAIDRITLQRAERDGNVATLSGDDRRNRLEISLEDLRQGASGA